MTAVVRRASVAFAIVVALVVALVVAPLARCTSACEIARTGLMSESGPACHHGAPSPTASVAPAPHPCGVSGELPAISSVSASTGDALAFGALGVFRTAWTSPRVDLPLFAIDASPNPIVSASSFSNAPLRL
ncbi:MAG: hypothetical protein ABJA98_16475 [Acidobacteriota bacterium]